MEIISLDELRVIAGEKGFGIATMEKDYLVTYLLFLIKDIKGIYFKGGTALNKIFLNHARLSEDLDFTVTADLENIEKEIKEKVEGTIFKKITSDKRVDKFIRLVMHYHLYHEDGTIFIDLNERDRLLLPAESHEIKHFYPHHIPAYVVKTSHTYEMMADKMAAAIGRNRPRDHLDLYNIVQHKFLLDLELVKKKCESSGDKFDITKMFNKAQKLKRRWDEDVEKFLRQKISFEEVMSTLAKHFDLKREKEKKKKTDEEISNSDGYKQLVKDLKLILEQLPKRNSKKFNIQNKP